MAVVPTKISDRIIRTNKETLRERPFAPTPVAKESDSLPKPFSNKLFREEQFLGKQKQQTETSPEDLLWEESQNLRAILKHKHFRAITKEKLPITNELIESFEKDMANPEKGPGPYVIKNFGNFDWQKLPFIFRPSEHHSGHYVLTIFCYIYQNRIFRNDKFEKFMDFNLVHYNLLFKPVPQGYQTYHEKGIIDLRTNQPMLEADQGSSYKTLDDLIRSEIAQTSLDEYLKDEKQLAERLPDGSLYKHPKHIVSFSTLIEKATSLREYSKKDLDADEIHYEASCKRASETLKNIEEHFEDYSLAMIMQISMLEDMQNNTQDLIDDNSMSYSTDLVATQNKVSSLANGSYENETTQSKNFKEKLFQQWVSNSSQNTTPKHNTKYSLSPIKGAHGLDDKEFNASVKEGVGLEAQDYDSIFNRDLSKELEVVYNAITKNSVGKEKNLAKQNIELSSKGLTRSNSTPMEMQRMIYNVPKGKSNQGLSMVPVLIMRSTSGQKKTLKLITPRNHQNP